MFASVGEKQVGSMWSGALELRMFDDVIVSGVSVELWQALRSLTRARVTATLGDEPPQPVAPHKVISNRSHHGLRVQEIRFPVTADLVASATILYPPDKGHGQLYPGLVAVHGSHNLGRYATIDPVGAPGQEYGLELARQGWVVMTADQFGFGDWLSEGQGQTECYADFYRHYPDWSLDGIRLRIQRCALDLLCAHPRVDSSRLATMGHSLGGRTSLLLAALDERVAVTIASTGVSSNLTNVFRNTPPHPQLSPRLNRAIAQTGRPPWEYTDLLALVAPRGLVLLEDFNDPYNPMIGAVLECFSRSRKVWELYRRPENLCLLCHGQGHSIPANLRQFAYTQLSRMLLASMTSSTELATQT